MTTETAPFVAAQKAVQKRTLAVLAAMQVIGTIGVGVAPSIGILVADELTNNEAWAGLARTSSTLGAALMGVPFGLLAARCGRRFALSTGWWTAACGSALLVLAVSQHLVALLFFGLFLMGAGLAVSLQARFAATDLADVRHHGRALSLIVWVGTIGSVLGPNLAVPGRYITNATGLSLYASAFAIAALCMAMAGVISFTFLRPDPLLESLKHSAAARPLATPLSQKEAFGQVFTELRINPGARHAVLAIVSAHIVMVAIMTMTPVHITHHGGSVEIVGITISLHVLGMYALAPLVGQLTDRCGHRITIVIGVLIFFASLLAGVFKAEDFGWIVFSLILLGLGWSFVNVAGSALFSSVVSAQSRTAAQGGVDALSNFCGAFAALISGPLLALTSFPVLSIFGMLALVPLLLLVLTRYPQIPSRP
ncbi:MFS transporter [Corynebacterium flavescens]